MFKKALSLLLALMLIVASFSVAMVSVAALNDDAAGSASDLNVTATSNVFPTTVNSFSKAVLDANDGQVVVTYAIQSEEKLLNADWVLTYDNTVLQFDEAANTTGEGQSAKLNLMPCAPDAVINVNPTSVESGIKGNCTSLSTYDLCAEDGGEIAFVTVTFKAIGSGDTTVDLNVSEMRVTHLEEGQSLSEKENETQLVEDGAVAETAIEYTTSTEVKTGENVPESSTEATEATEASTEPEETEDTTSPEVTDNTYVVAGSPADIFGTAWDATNEDNLMTENGDGKFEKTYTADKAYEGVQLKVVKNGAEWIGDSTGNNVTFDLTDAGEFTVTIDPETNEITVTGDNVKFSDVMPYDTVYAVGNGEGAWLNGAAWDPSFAANEMTEVAEGVFEIEFANVPDGFERQIKFAIDGAWTHNFGGVFEASGVESDAVYNGDNITFDTEDDSQTVKAQLDLRNFDFATKEGAKFTITITSGDEPVPSTEPAPVANVFTVKATSNFFPETKASYQDLSAYEDENGDVFITVDYKMAAPDKYLVNLDVDELTWDPEVLEFKEAYNTYGSGRSAKFTIFKFAYDQGFSSMVNTFGDSNCGRVVGNYTSVSPAAYATEEDGSAITVVRAVFKVLNREPGETVVNCNLDTMSLCDTSVAEPYS